MLTIIERLTQILAILTGIFVIFIPLLGIRRADTNLRGRNSGAATHLLRWPVMLAQTIIFVAIGILLWRPVPIVFSFEVHLIILIFGSLLFFPGIALYLWGYRTLGRMFGISSGFGATLYQDHKLIQSGPYRIVRHPMYLAAILVAFGALLIFHAWAMVLFAPLSLIVVLLRARREDRLLAEEFGEEWNSYKREVRGWIPILRKGVK